MSEQEPIRVSALTLKNHWMGPHSSGMIDDHKRGLRLVVMEDGTCYAASFSDVGVQQQAETNEQMRLPCGCKMDVGGDMFVMTPCSPDCEYWLYAKAEAERQGKNLRPIVDPELSDEARKAFGV